MEQEKKHDQFYITSWTEASHQFWRFIDFSFSLYFIQWNKLNLLEIQTIKWKVKFKKHKHRRLDGKISIWKSPRWLSSLL